MYDSRFLRVDRISFKVIVELDSNQVLDEVRFRSYHGKACEKFSSVQGK